MFCEYGVDVWCELLFCRFFFFFRRRRRRKLPSQTAMRDETSTHRMRKTPKIGTISRLFLTTLSSALQPTNFQQTSFFSHPSLPLPSALLPSSLLREYLSRTFYLKSKKRRTCVSSVFRFARRLPSPLPWPSRPLRRPPAGSRLDQFPTFTSG